MPTANTPKLQQITTFPALVEYLRDELDWPIEVDNADELTFEYEPAELGIDPVYAVKIKSIKQIRPLAPKQPWGIFFVEFESKRLPVVVLRRILHQFVATSRRSHPDRPVWQLDDLLFISTFGGAAAYQREIAIANFHQEAGDLPTLRVLGWDGADTILKLDYVAATLKERLRWPSDPGNIDAWRQQWASAFRHRLGHVIRTADALAERLAILARAIRDAARTLMAHESPNGPLRRLHKAFQTALIHDLSEADFADTYAQTITYGLLTAAISRTEMSEGRQGTSLMAGNVTDMVPITNPFLREMLQTFLQAGGRQGGIDFDELGIQDVVELLRGDETDLPAILRDFGNRTRGEDPVIHFYEHFLSAYNKQLKVQRGVFYTPQPVVSYIVRSVHELLQSEFGLEDGLASTVTWGEMAQRHSGLKIPAGVSPAAPFVQILDPATGTATFLVEVIDVIHRTLTAKWRRQRLSEAQQRAAWNDYVPRHLLPRLYGYELMMAPYAIAHMKVGLKLWETGYRFGSDERARIYLTNALEPASDGKRQLSFADWFPALAHEAWAVDQVKQKNSFSIVIGNPPYSGHSANDSEWVAGLLRGVDGDGRRVGSYFEVDGQPLNERNPKWLNDDYVKFIRFGQWRIEQTGAGILAFITNHGYLDNPTFRGMRQSLIAAFDAIYALDLHGSLKKREIAPDGSPDENVFDIEPGVSILLAVKYFSKKQTPRTAGICRADLWGRRSQKYDNLLKMNTANTEWQPLVPVSPFYLFSPQDTDIRSEYTKFQKITEVMPTNVLGFQTHRDNFAIAFDESEIYERIESMRNKDLSDEQFRSYFGVRDNRDWQLSKARKQVRTDQDWHKPVTLCGYRPFDNRWCYFSTVAMDYPRRELLDHVFGRENLCLLSSRQQATLGYRHSWVVKLPAESCLVSTTSREGNQVFPLYLYTTPETTKGTLFATQTTSREPNLAPSFIQDISDRLELRFVADGRGNLTSTLGPEDIFHYAYAILHSPTYRRRYAEFLKIDFPRLPLTTSLPLFRALCQLGADLVALHLLEDDYAAASWSQQGQPSPLQKPITTFVKRATGTTVGTVSKSNAYDQGKVYLDTSNRARSSYFEGVPEEVWNFHIGGYQVCHKWLYDRSGSGGEPGRTLSEEDIAHYQRIVVALKETIRLMGEIDEVIEEHGGWPLVGSVSE